MDLLQLLYTKFSNGNSILATITNYVPILSFSYQKIPKFELVSMYHNKLSQTLTITFIESKTPVSCFQHTNSPLEVMAYKLSGSEGHDCRDKMRADVGASSFCTHCPVLTLYWRTPSSQMTNSDLKVNEYVVYLFKYAQIKINYIESLENKGLSSVIDPPATRFNTISSPVDIIVAKI